MNKQLWGHLTDEMDAPPTVQFLEQAEHEQRKMARALHETATVINSTLDLDTVLEYILIQAANVVPCDAANIMLVDDNLVQVIRYKGFSEQGRDWVKAQKINFRLSDIETIQRIAETRLALAIPDVRDYPGWQTFSEVSEWVRSYVGAPMIAQGKLIGILNLDSADVGAFTDEEAEHLVAFANQAALAIQNARHATDLEQRVIERTAALRHAKEHVEAILNNSSDAIILLRPDGIIDQINPAFTQLIGWSADEAYGVSLLDFVMPENAGVFQETWNAVIDDRQSRHLETTICRQDGSCFSAELTLYTLTNDKLRVVCNLRDISIRKQEEENLRQALEKAQQLSEMKNRFIAMVSHEFRTPLATIQSSDDILKRYSDRLSEERKLEHLNKIQAQVKRLVNLLDDVLAINRADSVGMEFNPQPFDVYELYRDVAEEFQLNDPDYQILFETDVPGLQEVIDPKLVRQIINNLLSNAIKYSAVGSTIHLELTYQNQQIIITVRDQGIGIPEEDKQHLFELFHRARNVGNIKGTGLGLGIIKRAVDAHNGTIHFESQLGEGTIFTVTLPVVTSSVSA
ncbi:MAG: PAS domain S-box protein [Anaerolineae bacterium]|nr:PAS domain S-box protein [Anaerolineae bacterium]